MALLEYYLDGKIVPPLTSPCVNRYLHDFQNTVFFLFIILFPILLINIYSSKNNLGTKNFISVNSYNILSEKLFIYLIFFYHATFTIFHIILNDCKEVIDPFPINPNDANSLYINAGYFFDYIFFELGSNFISYIIHPFVTTLKISFLNINLFFSTIGFFGVLSFYLITKKKIYNKNKNLIFFLLILVLLPNLHYWTSYLTKDVIIFSFLSFYLFYTFSKKENLIINYLLFLYFIIVFLIRPYIGLFFILGHGIAYIGLIKNYRILDYRIIILFISFVSIILYLFFILINRFEFTGLFDTINNILLYLQNRFDATSSSVTIMTDKSYIVRQMIYFFVPLEFTISSSFKDNLAYFNNLILLLIFCFLFFHIIYNFTYLKDAFLMMFEGEDKKTQKLGLLFFFLITWFAYSQTSGNYGIIMRQKESIMFIMYFYLFYINSNILYLKKK